MSVPAMSGTSAIGHRGADGLESSSVACTKQGCVLIRRCADRTRPDSASDELLVLDVSLVIPPNPADGRRRDPASTQRRGPPKTRDWELRSTACANRLPGARLQEQRSGSAG